VRAAARPEDAPAQRRSLWSPGSVALIALMALGSAAMWIGLPIALLWAASLLADSRRPGMGPYVLVLVGLPLGMLAVGRLLAGLDRRHARLVGARAPARARAAWLRSMRDDRVRPRSGGVLDTVMLVSVAVCLLALAIWFVAFAGSSLPG
jgi:hypothetical protein